MFDKLTDEQLQILITALIDNIAEKESAAELSEAYTEICDRVIDEKNTEIEALKEKLRASKAPKVTKVTKKALPAPVKRKPGRPKKVAK